MKHSSSGVRIIHAERSSHLQVLLSWWVANPVSSESAIRADTIKTVPSRAEAPET